MTISRGRRPSDAPENGGDADRGVRHLEDPDGDRLGRGANSGAATAIALALLLAVLWLVATKLSLPGGRRGIVGIAPNLLTLLIVMLFQNSHNRHLAKLEARIDDLRRALESRPSASIIGPGDHRGERPTTDSSSQAVRGIHS